MLKLLSPPNKKLSGILPTRAWNQTWNSWDHQPDSNLRLVKSWETAWNQIRAVLPLRMPLGPGRPHSVAHLLGRLRLNASSMHQTKWKWYGHVTYTNIAKLDRMAGRVLDIDPYSLCSVSYGNLYLSHLPWHYHSLGICTCPNRSNIEINQLKVV